MSILKLLDSDSMELDEFKVHQWESLINSPLLNNNISTVDVEHVDGDMYQGDFYGLLHNILDIPNSACYVNMRINGLTGSTEYNGFTKIKLLDPEVFENIQLFIKQRENIA